MPATGWHLLKTYAGSFTIEESTLKFVFCHYRSKSGEGVDKNLCKTEVTVVVANLLYFLFFGPQYGL